MKKVYIAKLGTIFWYEDTLDGRIGVGRSVESKDVRSDNVNVVILVPTEDFMEFAAFLSGTPPWDPVADDHDRDTANLMLAHVNGCPLCTPRSRCDGYWKLVVDRVRAKESRGVN